MTNEELRRMRKAKPLTQAELANAIGCSRQAIIHWENAVHPVPDVMVPKIMAACMGPAPATKANQKKAKAELEAYTQMRGEPGGSHADIMSFWARHNYVPTPEGVALILAAWPDINGEKK